MRPYSSSDSREPYDLPIPNRYGIQFSWKATARLLCYCLAPIGVAAMLYLRSEFATHQEVKEAVAPVTQELINLGKEVRDSRERLIRIDENVKDLKERRVRD